jgi:C4-dicarboxylate-specific signal transduction histidine kinase
MLQASHFARIQSLRLDLGIPWPTRWILLAITSMFLTVLGIQYGLQNPVLRVQFNFGVGAALLFHLALLARRIGHEEQSRSAHWIALGYGLVATTMLFRVYAVTFGTGNVNLMTEGLSSQLLALAVLLSSVIGHFGYVGLALDRSMRREIKVAAALARDEESRRLGEQIAQLDRQRSLGEMSASLGHELNQPLTAILTNAQVARRGLQAGRFDTEQLTEFIDKIIQNTQRASQIIDRIRGFIRPVATQRAPVNLVNVIHEVIDLVADEIKTHKVHLSLAADGQPVWVTGDSIQLSQILLNIVRNACEALSQVTQREIRIAIFSRDGRARLQVSDTGPGLAAEILKQAGTPFFTTKPTGLGMGLSISRAIAEQHGGTLTISNADGGGAQVELELAVLPAPTFEQAAK